MILDDTKWFSSRSKLGVDYVIVVSCGAMGSFKCYSKEQAIEAIKQAEHRGCGYSLSSEPTPLGENCTDAELTKERSDEKGQDDGC